MVSRTIIYVAIAGAVGIGLALGSYYLIKAMARKPEEEIPKEEIPEEIAPTITVDKGTYSHGELLKWEARGLKVGKKYAVGVFDIYLGGPWILPSRDIFVAERSIMRGTYLIGTNIKPGRHYFVLYEYTDSTRREVDSVPITIEAKASAFISSLFSI
jgi:hypothetical protein